MENKISSASADLLSTFHPLAAEKSVPLLAVDQGNHAEELTDLTPASLPGERESPWPASSPFQTWDRSQPFPKLPSKTRVAAMDLWHLRPKLEFRVLCISPR